jgi:hypothetical protein
MVPKVHALGGIVSPQGIAGTRFTAEQGNPKKAVTSHILACFPSFFNAFCTGFCTVFELWPEAPIALV